MKKLLFTLLCLAGVSAQAQTCLTTVPSTTPTSNFTDNLDGTITDLTTGLTWMTCSVGQTYDTTNLTCTGEATQFTWEEALETAYGYEYANSSAWRVPNVKELTSITERSCVRPSINETIFPATPSDDYWTSTPSLRSLGDIWVVAFFNSSNSLKPRESSVFLRLVRPTS
ncbi:MAG: DUF1566 domain-containing protein [Alteromonadaceae bacterium]|nr:DUF1566 domain-containing protein [Alteromonadaceae bacterium]